MAGPAPAFVVPRGALGEGRPKARALSLDGLGGWEPFKGSAVAGTGAVSLWNRQLGFAGSRWGCGLGEGELPRVQKRV